MDSWLVATTQPEQAALPGPHQLQPVGAPQAPGQLLNRAWSPPRSHSGGSLLGLDHPAGDVGLGQPPLDAHLLPLSLCWVSSAGFRRYPDRSRVTLLQPDLA